MIRTARYAWLVLAITLGVAVNANASDPYKAEFNAFYQTSGGNNYQPVLGSCLTCHTSGSTRNAYGTAWRSAGYDFAAIEALDSDVDGFTNIAEINARTFPGDPNSKPVIANTPPIANAGPDQTVNEGVTVTLDGSASADLDDGIVGYLWSQNGGPQVVLLDATAVQPTFVTPAVDVGGATLDFTLTVTDSGGLKSSSQVFIGVNDNGITQFPADVISTLTFAGEPFGVKENNGGSFIRLEPIDPATMPASAGEPQDMFFGLIDMEIKVAAPGDTTTVTIYLPAPVPAEHKWFKYTAGGWTDFSEYAEFNATRDQVTLTLADGGPGDDDGVVNGVILDPSGPGVASQAALVGDSPSSVSTTAGDWGGGGGCFIAAAGCETAAELTARLWTSFRDILVRFGLTD